MPDIPEKIVTLGKIWGCIRGMPLSKVFATNNNRFQGGGKGKMAGKKDRQESQSGLYAMRT